jgi:hypothetical protein
VQPLHLLKVGPISKHINSCRKSKNIVTNMTIAGKRFSEHVPAATNRCGINTHCYEIRSLQTNSVQGAFPWQQTGNRHFPWLAPDYKRSRAEKNDSWHPCEGGVEYLHRDLASRRRRRKWKSQIWDSKIRSQVLRDYDRERLRWRGPAAHTKDRFVLSSERASHGIKNVTVRRIPYSERKKKIWS